MIKGKVLLLGKEQNFLVDLAWRKMDTKYGAIDLTKIKKIGQQVKSNKGDVFIVVSPNYPDFVKKFSRGPQVVLPKDAVAIVGITGLSSGWKCLDAGGGSAFLSTFIGNIVKPSGKVYTYEKRKDFIKNIKKNIEMCELEKIVEIKNKDVKTFKEKDLDLITLDMKGAENMLTKARKALKFGGWIVVFSPHIEQQKKVVEQLKKNNFVQVKTIENIQRPWQVNDFTHPHISGLLHTCFMTFGRKWR